MSEVDTFETSENMKKFFDNLFDLKRQMQESLQEDLCLQSMTLVQSFYDKLDEIIKEEV